MSESSESPFSKIRLEMLCDGIFAIVMTLLVLELKPPALPRGTPPPEVWHAIREHGLSFVGFVLSFVLAGQFWMLHHAFFHYLRHATRLLAVLTLLFLMFVSFLPFSTSMFTAFGPRHQVGLVFYLGNQFMLSLLLAVQWLLARRVGALTESAEPRRKRFEAIIFGQPVAFLLSLVAAVFAPSSAMTTLLYGQAGMALFANVAARRAERRQAAAA